MERVLESTQLTVLTSNTCTAECAHCCMNSGPRRRGKLTLSAMQDYIDQAAANRAIDTIIFAGGEPLLLGEDIFAAIRHVRSSCLKSRLVTNAYWAINDDITRTICKKLCEAGLDELNISIDDYHLPFISADRVRRAFQAARDFDFQSVIIVHCKGPSTHFNDAELDELLGESLPRLFDDRCERSLLDSGKRPFLAVSNTAVTGVGRAMHQLSSADYSSPEQWEDRARQLGGCPWAVRSPAISPDGHLVACCGFETTGNPVLDIGDLAHHSMAELLEKADNDVALNWIALEGPYAIMDFLRGVDRELPFRPHYSSYCELCEHMVTDPALRSAMQANAGKRAFFLLEVREILNRT